MNEDVRDILDVERPATAPAATKESLMAPDTKKSSRRGETIKRPQGMHREVFALLYSDSSRGNASSIVATDTGSGYRQPRARLGHNRVRAWKWVGFTNPARKDGAKLFHWRREADEAKEYAYSRFNKSVDIPSYTAEEYNKHLSEDQWTKEATDHLFALCRQFDLRFTIIHDRFDHDKYKRRSIEDLKEHYYSVYNRLNKARAAREMGGASPDLVAYDAEHERKRKLQLERLYNRTHEQVEQEEILIAELKKIELRKKEREKKQQDLQKLITAAEQSADTGHKSVKKGPGSANKKTRTATPQKGSGDSAIVFRSYDKSSGVSLRSSKVKMPPSIGQKKAKIIEQCLDDLHVPLHPMPTEQITVEYNELRSEILLLLDLKATRDSQEFELQSLKHRLESLSSDKQPRDITPHHHHHHHHHHSKKGSSLSDLVGSGHSSGRKRRNTLVDGTYKKSRKS